MAGISIEHLLIAFSLLLVASVYASKASERIGVPSLLLFLAVGMLAGSDGPGGIYFDDAGLAQKLGVVALCLILFAGGLETEWTTIRPVLREGVALSVVGVLLTAGGVAAFTRLALGFSWMEGFLIGSIMSSTDAAAVFSVLRSRRIGLVGRLRPLLELESGSNDAMAVFLTISAITLMKDQALAPVALAGRFALQLSLGLAAGWAAGKSAAALINRSRLDYEGLYPVLSLAAALLTCGATAALGGSGFLAVYVFGLVLGNTNFVHKKSLVRFHDGLAWLMQIAMFLTLGLLVFPGQLLPVAGMGLLVSGFLMFVARPAAVFLTLLPSGFTLSEKTMVGWVGLRGAVPIILATFPLLAGLDESHRMFNLVFFVVITSVLLQGTTIPVVAKLLGVAAPVPHPRRLPLDFEAGEQTDTQLLELIIPYDRGAAGKSIVSLGMPRESVIALIVRGDRYLIPDGETVLDGGDVLMVLAGRGSLEGVKRAVLGETSARSSSADAKNA